jgi:hypothetical protein
MDYMKKESQLKEVISSTLLNNSTLPAPVLTGYWNTAKLWKDEDILSDLIRREDLPEPLVLEAKKFTSIRLRTSYLLRTKIKEEEFDSLTINENRAGVLAGVVDELDIKKFPNFDKTLLKAIVKKPTRKLSESIINSKTASKELYLEALLAAPNEELTSEFERNIYARVGLLAQDEKLYNRLLSSADNPERIQKWAYFAINNKGVSSENRKLAIELMIIPALQDLEEAKNTKNNRLNTKRNNLIQLIKGILNLEDIQPEIVLALRKIVLAYPNLQGDLEDVLSDLDPEILAEKDRVRQKLIAELISTNSMEFIRTTIKGGYRNIDEEYIFAALTNTNLDSETEIYLLRNALDANYEKALQIVKDNPSDVKALEVYKQNYSSIINEDNYQLFSSPTVGRELCIKQSYDLVEGDYRSLYSRWNLLEAVVEEMPEMDPSLGTIPWEFLVERSSGWYRERSATKKIIAYWVKLQSETLGDDPHKWETLNILSQDFTGSLNDLVQTASSI